MTTLMYHDIFSISPGESGFTFRTAMPYKVELSIFVAGLKALKALHPDNLGEYVEFTFDDGGVSAMEVAAILEENGLRGIFFISTAFIGKPGFLTAEQIHELHESGHIIGAHSHSHPYEKKAIALEWEESVKILSGITGAPITTASSPHGLVSKDIIRKAAACGITTLYTTEPTIGPRIRSGVEIKGRFCIHRNDSPHDICLIALDRRKQSAMHVKWKALSILRAMLGKHYPKLKTLFYYPITVSHNKNA